MKGLEKLQQIYPDIDKPITRLTSNPDKFKRAAQKIQAAIKLQDIVNKKKAKGAIEVMKKNAERSTNAERKAAANGKKKTEKLGVMETIMEEDDPDEIIGGKRKSKKLHYKPIIKTKTIRKKMLKLHRTKKRDKINRRRSRK